MPKNSLPKFYDFPYLLLILAVFLWSVNFIVGRAVRADVPPIGLAFWRWSGASLLIFFPALRHLKHDWKQARKNLPILLLLSATGVAVFNTLVYMGLQQTIVINAVLMQSMMPVLIVAMSFLCFKEKIYRLQALGIALSLSGALSIILKGDPSLLGSMSINRGDLLIFIAVICYAAYSVMLRRRPAIHPLSLSGNHVCDRFGDAVAFLFVGKLCRPPDALGCDNRGGGLLCSHFSIDYSIYLL